ncbi:hypothetical protein [Clostridium beijerinckii]|uniref:Transposase InsH N-terminal domain-containing protein n=1 Tax=Clostridium beijerinckii TaxID=1520 RepID=A0AAX0B8I0_CLOBE|nr:hypothetical protein [Clostridium beijerinckii]NRT91281.1 hypothetical protein [Clostridium beijerinckii]NYC70807.1 hypothetical protein [Clostridium beijerinckii]
MRKNYFAKLVKYMKNVYHIENGINKLTDLRVNPTYDTAQIIKLVLLFFLLRIKSFNELNLMIKIMNSENYFLEVQGYHWSILLERLLKSLILKV